VSKQSRKKARKRRRAAVAKRQHLISTICQQCGAMGSGSPAAMLSVLADALNTCADAGIRIRVRHGALIALEGYVLPLAGGKWTARTLNYDPFLPYPVLLDEDGFE